MTCSFCAKTFLILDAEKTCRSCAVFGGCQKVKCPYCGYESPRETNVVHFFRKVNLWKFFHPKKQVL